MVVTNNGTEGVTFGSLTINANNPNENGTTDISAVNLINETASTPITQQNSYSSGSVIFGLFGSPYVLAPAQAITYMVRYNFAATALTGTYSCSVSLANSLQGTGQISTLPISVTGTFPINGVNITIAPPTSTPTVTNTPFYSFTPTNTPTITATPTATATNTTTSTATNTTTNTATNTTTSTATNTATSTPVNPPASISSLAAPVTSIQLPGAQSVTMMQLLVADDSANEGVSLNQIILTGSASGGGNNAGVTVDLYQNGSLFGLKVFTLSNAVTFAGLGADIPLSGPSTYVFTYSFPVTALPGTYAVTVTANNVTGVGDTSLKPMTVTSTPAGGVPGDVINLATATSTPTNTATFTATTTPTFSPSATRTFTPTNTTTNSATSTYTNTPVFSFTPTNTPTVTSSPTATATDTTTSTATKTTTNTATLTPTSTATNTATSTPVNPPASISSAVAPVNSTQLPGAQAVTMMQLLVADDSANEGVSLNQIILTGSASGGGNDAGVTVNLYQNGSFFGLKVYTASNAATFAGLADDIALGGPSTYVVTYDFPASASLGTYAVTVTASNVTGVGDTSLKPMTVTSTPPTGVPGAVITLALATSTPTFTATSTATLTATFTPTMTQTNTATNTTTSTKTYTPTVTPTFTPSSTPTATTTNSATSTPTITPTFTVTSTATQTPLAGGSSPYNGSANILQPLGIGASYISISIPANAFPTPPSTLSIGVTEFGIGAAPSTQAVPPDVSFLSTAYFIYAGGGVTQLEPRAGVTLTLTFPYNHADIQVGQTAGNLAAAYFNGTVWVVMPQTSNTTSPIR